MSDTTAKSWAVLFARLVLGLIFFMAGVWKVFGLGPVGHVQRFFLPFQHTFLPLWSLWAVGFTIPFVELIAGGLVIVGWKTRYALRGPRCGAGDRDLRPSSRSATLRIPRTRHSRLALVLFVLLMPAGDRSILARPPVETARIT